VRLYGIDAPERNQPGGAEAADFIKPFQGQEFSIQEMDVDRYGRTVALVLLPDGTNLNLALVRAGHAGFYPQYCKTEPICEQIQSAETEARTARRALWAQDDPLPPWEWRKLPSRRLTPIPDSQ